MHEVIETPVLLVCKGEGCRANITHPEDNSTELPGYCWDCAARLECDCCNVPDATTCHRPDTKSFLRDACHDEWLAAPCEDCGEPNGTRGGCACNREPESETR